MSKIIGFGIVILALHLTATEAIQCLSCDNVVEARDCRKLVTCGSHEICYVQRLIATNLKQYYKLGCTDKNVCLQEQSSMFAMGKRDTSNKYSAPVESRAIVSRDRKTRETNGDMVLCLQCCDGADGCNNDLCGSSQTSNLRCLTCNDVLSPKDCESLQECSRDEFCYVHKGINPTIATFEIRHDMGCMGERQCNALKLIYPQACVACCNQTDLCNYAACDKWTPGITPSKPPPTTPTTTTTTPLPTTPPPKVIINGPDKEKYLIQTQLTCVTNPPAQSYRWKFNGTANLPTGITTQQVGTQAGSVAGIDTLHIANLTEAQLGTYTCVATINGQTVERSHFLGIIGEKPTVHIEKPPVSQNFAMQCRVTGYPAPHIDWDFVPDAVGAHGIPPGVQFLHEAYQSTLFVTTYSPVEHTGEWYCKASNLVGSALAQVHVP